MTIIGYNPQLTAEQAARHTALQNAAYASSALRNELAALQTRAAYMTPGQLSRWIGSRPVLKMAFRGTAIPYAGPRVY